MGPGRRIALVLLLVPLLALGCSNSEEPEPEVVANDDPGLGIEIRVKSPRESGGGSGHAADSSVKYDLRVRLETSASTIEIGSPLPVKVVVENTGDKDQYLYELSRCLADGHKISILPPSWVAKKPLVFGTRRKDAGPKKAEDFVCLSPGESMRAPIDLAPLLALMDASPPGPYRISLIYESSYKGESFGIRSWNEMGYKRIASTPIVVDIAWPEWKSRQGVTMDLERQIENILDSIGRDGKLDPAFRDLLVKMGPAALTVLEEKIGGCSETNFAHCLTGWNAFYALAALRREAMPYLASSPNAGRNVNIFLTEIISEIEMPGEDSETADLLAKLRKPAKGASPYAARLTKHNAKGKSRSVTVHADGRVVLLEPVGQKILSRTAFLGPEGVTDVFAALHDNVFWIQRPMRTSGNKKEALLSFALLEDETPVHAAEVWETEAVVGNRHLGQVNIAFRAIEKKAREHLASKSQESTRKD